MLQGKNGGQKPDFLSGLLRIKQRAIGRVGYLTCFSISRAGRSEGWAYHSLAILWENWNRGGRGRDQLEDEGWRVKVWRRPFPNLREDH